MAYIAHYKLWKWYDKVGIVWKQIMNLVFDSTKVKWFALYHTNLSHNVPLSFVWLKFTSFGWDVDMRRIRSDKTLCFGIPKSPQVNIQGRSKQLSLGMPRKASPLSSPTLSVTSLRAIFLFITCYVFCLERIFNFTCCLNKIIGYEILNEKESSHGYLIIWLLSILLLYLFGVVCHLLTCFTYILWVNGWMNWIS